MHYVIIFIPQWTDTSTSLPCWQYGKTMHSISRHGNHPHAEIELASIITFLRHGLNVKSGRSRDLKVLCGTLHNQPTLSQLQLKEDGSWIIKGIFLRSLNRILSVRIGRDATLTPTLDVDDDRETLATYNV